MKIVRRATVVAGALALVLGSPLQASAAMGHIGKLAPLNAPYAGSFEMDWSTSGRPSSAPSTAYRVVMLKYWNPLGGLTPGRVRFQTQLGDGTVMTSTVVADGGSVARFPNGVWVTRTTKTELTRLSDGKKWCVYLIPSSASVTNRGCGL
jgi:hypothetical protein